MTATPGQQAKLTAHNEALAELQAEEELRLARAEGKDGVPHGYYQNRIHAGPAEEF